MYSIKKYLSRISAGFLYRTTLLNVPLNLSIYLQNDDVWVWYRCPDLQYVVVICDVSLNCEPYWLIGAAAATAPTLNYFMLQYSR